MLWFFLFHYCADKNVVYINDSTSSWAYGVLSQGYKDFYDENWYNPKHIVKKGSAHIMLKQVIDYIHDEFPDVNWVNFSEDEGGKNVWRLSALIQNTSKISNRILDIRWGRECSWTVQIRD